MPPSDPQTYFLQQGILGVIIVVLAGVIVWQQHRYDTTVKEKDLEIKSLFESVNKVQDLRIGDNQKTIAEATKVSAENTAAIVSLKESWKESVTRLIELIKN